MEELLVEFIKGFDLHTLVGMAVIVWFMTKGMRADIKDIKSNIASLDNRLVRIETMLHVKDCCMLKEHDQLKKAE